MSDPIKPDKPVSKGRKLLVAAIGVATVSYVVGCGTSDSSGPGSPDVSSGNLVAPDTGAVDVTAGNLMPADTGPGDADAASDATLEGATDGASDAAGDGASDVKDKG